MVESFNTDRQSARTIFRVIYILPPKLFHTHWRSLSRSNLITFRFDIKFSIPALHIVRLQVALTYESREGELARFLNVLNPALGILHEILQARNDFPTKRARRNETQIKKYTIEMVEIINQGIYSVMPWLKSTQTAHMKTNKYFLFFRSSCIKHLLWRA